MAGEKRKQAGQPMLIRFPEGSDLRQRLEEKAQANNRSLTAEIMWRLERSLDGLGALLEAQQQDIDTATELAYATHNNEIATDNRVFRLEQFATMAAAKLGIEWSPEGDPVLPKSKRRKG